MISRVNCWRSPLRRKRSRPKSSVYHHKQCLLDNKDDLELEEAAEEVGEEEFRLSYMPEDRGSDMAINFISMQAKSRDESHDVENVATTFNSVEGMIKGVFPQLLNVQDGKVGQAKNCAMKSI